MSATIKSLRGRQGEPQRKPVKVNLDDLSIKHEGMSTPYGHFSKGDIGKLKVLYRMAKELDATDCQTEAEFIAAHLEIDRKYGGSRG